MAQLLNQFAYKVVNFSSQYGGHGTSSYVAKNLAGSCQVGERYGDFTTAFVLRSYGTWWKTCPSAVQKLKKAAPSFISEDFVELEYNVPVIPSSIVIYETYHPGSVVRILACNANPRTDSPGKVKWVTLWSGSPQCSQVPQAMRKFSPPLKNIAFPTKFIRLEFNSEECGYYTELDAVELTGKQPEDAIDYIDRADGFHVSVTTQLLHQLSLLDRQISTSSQDDDDYEKWGYWAYLPDELIQHVLSYLDIISLCNVAQTCSLLLKNTYDPLLYSDLDLQSRWNTVDDLALESLSGRCSYLERLNLSWTGGGGQLTEEALCRFLEACGSELRTLRLACCQYLTEHSMATIARVCSKLEELDLQSCSQLNRYAFSHIGKMTKLRRLNLYGMKLMDRGIFNAIGNCIKLEHLNIGGLCVKEILRLAKYEDLAEELCASLSNLKNLVSLDMWRLKLGNHGVIKTITENCTNLQELDIGWSKYVGRRAMSCERMCSKLPNLKKLFLTSARALNDTDLQGIATHCKHLEQLDILGTNLVSAAGAEVICKSCPLLTFFDLSFCGQLNMAVVDELRAKYPKVCFKKSFS